MGFGRSPMVGDAYIPFAQKPTLQVSVMLRTAAPLAEATMATLRESITAIDPGVPVFDVAPMIRRVRDQGATILMIEHVMQAVMNLSDRAYVLNNGAIIASGTPGEIVENPAA